MQHTNHRARQPAEVAKILKKIYQAPFGGKDRGRFLISRQDLREISRKKRLEEPIVTATINEAYEQGFVVTDHGEAFSVIEESVMRNYRKVPKAILSNHK